jgi:uncharacterized membrane protein
VGIVAAIAYSAFLGAVLCERYWAFQTSAWDLGNFNQGMWTALFDHRLFYYTADLPSGNTGSLLASHFSPFLFLLLPFYALAPGPPGLLVIEAVGLAAGTVPLYFLSRRLGLSEAWTLLVEVGYLLSPVLMGIGWYDFHAEAFLPVTVIFTVYCYYYGGRWVFAASWILCLAVIETVAPLLLLFAAAGCIGLLWDYFKRVSHPRLDWEKTVIAVVVAPIWLGVAQLFNQVVNHGGLGTLGTGYSSAWSVLGPNLSFAAVVPYALTHPSAAAAALQVQGTEKAAYVVFLLGSFAFLSLLGPKRLLLPAAAWLVLVLLSNGGSLVEFGVQDGAYAFAFLAAAFPFGLVRVRALIDHRRSAPARSASSSVVRPWHGRLRRSAAPIAISTAVVLAVAISSASISPLLAEPSWNYPEVAHGIPTVTQHDLDVHAIIGLIPPGAGVLTVSNLFPEVSSRVHAYVDPLSSSFRPNLTFVAALDGYVNDSQFVLVDFYLDYFDSSVLMQYANLSAFGVRAEEDQIILLERGWEGGPELFVPFEETWCADQLGFTQYMDTDPTNSTPCGPALTSIPNAPSNSLLWYGPYVSGLLPGTYAVTSWVSADAKMVGAEVKLESVSYPLALDLVQYGSTDAQHTYGFNFYSTGTQLILNATFVVNPGPGPRTITGNLTTTFAWEGLSVWGVAGWVLVDDCETHLYAVTLDQLSP